MFYGYLVSSVIFYRIYKMIIGIFSLSQRERDASLSTPGGKVRG
jgi:hypothetical protein